MSRVALVTGASGAIGGAVARALAADGTTVACAYRSDREAAETVVKEIGVAGGIARSFEADVADEEQVAALFEEVGAWKGAPTILVNAAGVVHDGLALRYPAERFREVLEVNLTGAFLVARAALRTMLRERWGRIVNVGSVAGLIGNPGQTAYSASKAGLVGFTRSLAKEVGSRGITVNAVCPGVVDAGMAAGLSDQARDRLVAATPAGRGGRPEEVAAVARFLAGEDASYVNGAVVPVDGGMSA